MGKCSEHGKIQSFPMGFVVEYHHAKRMGLFEKLTPIPLDYYAYR